MTSDHATVAPGEQLVVELYVRNLKQSLSFYQQWGFQIVRESPNFVEIRWEHSHLMLLERAMPGSETAAPAGNMLILVSNVDEYWERAQRAQADVKIPIADRFYGLRDFTIAGPDGLEVRFASRLKRAA